MTVDYVGEALNDAPQLPNRPNPRLESPRPLMRELPPADPYPVDALGDVLKSAARAIHDRVQAPLAICGQSVLAAATLATQAHADVELPMGHVKPLSNYLVSVAATGERKSTVDTEALWPVRKREAALREVYTTDVPAYQNALAAFKAARDAAVKKAKGDRRAIAAALDALGPAPLPPVAPVLTCPEPTYEGMCRLLAEGQPSIGIFAAEGGQFIAGHGMTEESKLRTAAGLSALWDGEPIKRVRAIDGTVVLPGRRVALHLMAQPEVAALWMSDRLLIDQGLISRVLITAPDPASGTRMWREPLPESDAALRRYGARLLDILERPLALAPDTRNELMPRKLLLSRDARRVWIGAYNHIESRVAAGGELEPVRGLANKLPEHAARIAAVLTLIDDMEAGEISGNALANGMEIAQHCLTEALRLSGTSSVSGELQLAQRLLTWLHRSWPHPVVSLPDIYQRGPSAIRDKAAAQRAATVLSDHGWLVPASGCEIDGAFRREVLRIVAE
jgi:hypothetical protein